MNYISNLEKIKQEIDSNPLLEIVTFEVAPPVSEEQIKEIEQKHQIILDKSLKDFYRQANGCHLHWQLMPLSEEEYDTKVYGKFGDYEPDLEDDDENPFAQIKINSLKDCFLDDWFDYDNSDQDKFQFKDDVYNKQILSKKLKILDKFSTFSCIAYITDKKFETTPLVMLSGHYADWWNSYLTNFATYWQLLMQSRGIYEIKNDILGKIDGHKVEPITNLNDFGEQLTPKLFNTK